MALVTLFTTIGAQEQSVVEDILQYAFAPGAMNPRTSARWAVTRLVYFECELHNAPSQLIVIASHAGPKGAGSSELRLTSGGSTILPALDY
jgi:hypothetical protein